MPGLSFCKYSPSGNTTVLVTDPVPEQAERAALARMIMEKDHLGAEQVGYVNLSAGLPRLDMMGGELCLNACRAAAALLHEADRLTPDPHGTAGWRHGALSSSGVDEPLALRSRQLAGQAHRFEAAVRLPLPPTDSLPLAFGLWQVRLPGIIHLVLDAAAHPFPLDWSGYSARLRRQYGLEDEQAVGCLWLDRVASTLTPVVWVRDTGEAVLETACGSGTLACALHLALRQDHDFSRAHTIRQPGGEALRVTFEADGLANPLAAWLSGSVRLVARGELFVNGEEASER